MLSNDSGYGLMSLMGGMVVLVLAGVGLSIAVDGRFGLTEQATLLQNELKGGEADLHRLGELHAQSAHQIRNLEPGRRQAMDELKALRGKMGDLDRRQEALLAARESASDSFHALEQKFKAYRSKHRERVWAAAHGLSLGILETRGGRAYHDAVVRRVTDAGLEIRHAHGTARVAVADLDAGLQQRFLWE
jgi:hypothetical protein